MSYFIFSIIELRADIGNRLPSLLCKVESGCAIKPVGSLIEIPILFSPKSIPSERINILSDVRLL